MSLWSQRHPKASDDERSRVLSCLRLCTALDASLSLSKLLTNGTAGDIETFRRGHLGEAGLAVLSALSQTDEGDILSKVQALELCCEWLLRASSNNNKDVDALLRTAEVWALTHSGILASILVGKDGIITTLL